jgi:hypothetical protein
MNNKLESLDVGDFLVSYFDYLIGSYPDAFINNVEETRKTSLINDNNFFIGYIVLGRKLYNAKLKPRDVIKYIKDIDFSRDNPLWKELGILDEKGNITETNKARKAIKQYFENIKIEMKV